MKQVVYFFALFLFISCNNPKSKNYQWRGENRTGVYSETNLLKEWPENGPKELWFAEGLGNGYGSPTVTESEIFITGEKDSLAWMFCFGLNGDLIWKKQYGKEWAKHYPGSRSAPTVIDDLVYAGTGMGIISCLKRETGELVWTKDYVADFEGVLPYHGYSEAPVVFDDKIFCTPGGPENNVVALNRFTGELIWSCKGIGERMGYNPGNLIKLPDRKIYVTFSAYHLLGIDAETGEIVDSLRAGTGAIIAADNMLYYYNWGGELSLISCENGKLQKQSAFKITRGTKEHFSHPVIKNGVLYQRRGDALMAFDIRANRESRTGI
ncbi:MAG: PQQ-binding-like beta-propeller repeat protein [Mariniphaga sp.]|nr:PQQ-binding-like beta-propeller repeat protein [Mariniphaga sp.]